MLFPSDLCASVQCLWVGVGAVVEYHWEVPAGEKESSDDVRADIA